MYSLQSYNVDTIFNQMKMLRIELGDVLAQLEHLESQEDFSISTQEEEAYKIKQGKIALYLDQNEALWKNGKVIDPHANQDSLFHWAARNGHILVCSVLFIRGESLHTLNGNGKTVLELIDCLPEKTKNEIQKFFGLYEQSLS